MKKLSKKLILERLSETIQQLESLPDKKFLYNDEVAKYKITNEKNFCGTVCCVMGWYPKWFPQAGISWAIYKGGNNTVSTKSERGDTDADLMAYHGLSQVVIYFLFYGTEHRFRSNKKIFLISEKYKAINYNNSLGDSRHLSGFQLKKGLSSSREEVIQAFRFIQELVKKNLLK